MKRHVFPLLCFSLCLSIDFKIQVKQIVMRSLSSITKQVSKVHVVVIVRSCVFSCSLSVRSPHRRPFEFDIRCPTEHPG